MRLRDLSMLTVLCLAHAPNRALSVANSLSAHAPNRALSIFHGGVNGVQNWLWLQEYCWLKQSRNILEPSKKEIVYLLAHCVASPGAPIT